MPSSISESAEQTIELGERIGARCAGGEVIALHAPLGAGKTVLAKGIARGLGVTDVVTSPTYTIVSEYAGPIRLIHVDLYRIDTEDEYEQLAINELMDNRTVTLIEWPERAGNLLPGSTLAVEISIGPDGTRTIVVPDVLLSAPDRGSTA